MLTAVSYGSSCVFNITVVRLTTMMFDQHLVSMTLCWAMTHWFFAVFWFGSLCMSRIKIGGMQPFSCPAGSEVIHRMRKRQALKAQQL
jgi:hypothetical protein